MQLRSRQQEAEEQQETSRLAMLALSTQMAMSGVNVDSSRPSYRGSRLVGMNAASAVSGMPSMAHSAAVDSLQAAMDMPSVIASRGQAMPEQDQASRIFGLAFPGLVICDAGSKAYGSYAAVRDLAVTTKSQKLAADVLIASILVATIVAKM